MVIDDEVSTGRRHRHQGGIVQCAQGRAEGAADTGLAARGGHPEQDGGCDASGGGEFGVAGEFRRDAIGALSAEVELQEPLERGLVCAPPAVPVGRTMSPKFRSQRASDHQAVSCPEGFELRE